MNHTINSETSFGVFSVLKSSFWVSIQNIRLLSVLLALLMALTILFDKAFEELQKSYGASSSMEHFVNLLVLLKIVFEIMLLKVALVHSTFKTLSGKSPTFRKMSKRVKKFKSKVAAVKLGVISLIYLMIGFVFAVLLTSIMFVTIESGEFTPGYYFFMAVCIGFWVLLTKYYVVVPIAIIERKSVIASFSRSSVLTMDHKGSVFCLIWSLFFLVSIVIVLITSVYDSVMNVVGWDVLPEIHNPWISDFTWSFVTTFLWSVFAIFDGVTTTVAYMYLKDE